MDEFDPYVPQSLRGLQEWFGEVISTPLMEESQISPTAPSGNSIVEEASERVSPSPTLQPHERMQLYNQQYWWRLLSTLQEAFPLVVRLFGYTDFNQSISIPYLSTYPPAHWSLNQLGDSLPEWIFEFYKGNDRTFVYDAAVLDNAYTSLYFQPLLPPLFGEDLEILTKSLHLQPHVLLLSFDYDLIPFKEAMNEKDPDHWIDAPFPDLKNEKTHYALYRSRKGFTTWQAISPTELLLLKRIQNGTSIDLICEWLENQPNKIRSEAEKSLQGWFKNWTIRGLLTSYH